MQDIFIGISLIILVVLAISFVMRILKQPLIIGYILSGIVVGPLLFNILPEGNTLITFSEMGIAFLLFIVGLHLSPKVIKEVGKISIITGIGQVIFTSLIGYFIAIFLGFPKITSLYIAVALTFSSTIIIMKLLSDKEALEKLYGKISIGFLLVQDIIAIIVLLIVSSFSEGVSISSLITGTLIKGSILFIILVPIALYILPRFTSFFAKSQEFLFIFAIAWGLGLASLFKYIGFSLEAGALIAGVILSMTPYSFEISSKLRPLRDFFIISFFILLGSQMVFGDITNMIYPAIIFSTFILIGNPLIVMILMGTFGYSKNTGFMSGLTVAQISEFSLILIALGVKIGHIPGEIISLVTIIGLVTIAGSTYLIMFSDKIYPAISNYLNIFEKKHLNEKKSRVRKYEYFLLGENRIGFSIMNAFKKLKKDYLVIDYNPEIIKRLSSEKIPCIYGDLSNIDFLEDLNFKKSKLIVSTIPDRETNFIILRAIRKVNKSAVIIVVAREINDALEFYKEGADYVILSHFLGGSYTAKIIEDAKENKSKYKIHKERQIKELNERLKMGHEHPNIEKNRKHKR